MNGQDVFMREVAAEVGRTAERVLAATVGHAEDLVLFGLERLAARQAARGGPTIRSGGLIRALQGSAFVVPVAGGRIASVSTYLALRVGRSGLDRAARCIVAGGREMTRP
jgi:hypothetical protein